MWQEYLVLQEGIASTLSWRLWKLIHQRMVWLKKLWLLSSVLVGTIIYFCIRLWGTISQVHLNFLIYVEKFRYYYLLPVCLLVFKYGESRGFLILVKACTFLCYVKCRTVEIGAFWITFLLLYAFEGFLPSHALQMVSKTSSFLPLQSKMKILSLVTLYSQHILVLFFF